MVLLIKSNQSVAVVALINKKVRRGEKKIALRTIKMNVLMNRRRDIKIKLEFFFQTRRIQSLPFFMLLKQKKIHTRETFHPHRLKKLSFQDQKNIFYWSLYFLIKITCTAQKSISCWLPLQRLDNIFSLNLAEL